MSTEQKLYTCLVYGTLRPIDHTAQTALVPGYLYDLGWYPGIQMDVESKTDSRVVCERITVTPERLEQLDNYEGCNTGGDGHGLYSRETVDDPGSPNGWSYIYVYRKYGAENPFAGCQLIESGDWQEYTSKEKELCPDTM